MNKGYIIDSRIQNEKTNFIKIYGISYMRTAPKLMPPFLLCWSKKSEVNVGGMIPAYILLHVEAVQQMSAEGQPDI